MPQRLNGTLTYVAKVTQVAVVVVVIFVVLLIVVVIHRI